MPISLSNKGERAVLRIAATMGIRVNKRKLDDIIIDIEEFIHRSRIYGGPHPSSIGVAPLTKFEMEF